RNATRNDRLLDNVEGSPEVIADVFRAPRDQKSGCLQAVLRPFREAKREGLSREVEALKLVQRRPLHALYRRCQYPESLTDLERCPHDVPDNVAPMRDPERREGALGYNQSVRAHRPV